MPIHDGILRNYGKESVIALKGDQTLDDAIQRLAESGFPESSAYLVVEPVKQMGEPYQTSDSYLVTPFGGLYDLITKDNLLLPLNSFPFPPVMRVERKDTSESGKSIGDWVRATPRSTLVVIDDEGFVALLGNTDMTGGSGGMRQGSLRRKAALESGKENCPFCEDNEGFSFDGNKAKCKACRKEFDITK